MYIIYLKQQSFSNDIQQNNRKDIQILFHLIPFFFCLAVCWVEDFFIFSAFVRSIFSPGMTVSGDLHKMNTIKLIITYHYLEMYIN